MQKLSIEQIKVMDLIRFLQDCRSDAEVFSCLFEDSTEIHKVRKLINKGNHILLVREND